MEQGTTTSYPRISIVTPSFNQARFLEVTILSVLNQKYPNLEYFVMDGGSTDGSVEIIQKYASQLTYWESKPDRGQSHAINKGWRMATGELIAWLNSDDAYTPGTLFEVAEVWQKDKSVGFINGISEFIDEFGEPTGKLFGAEFNVLNALLSYHNKTAQQSTFISRSVIEKVGYLNENYQMAMDWDLWFRIGLEYRTIFVNKVWSKYRIWSDTKTEKLRLSSLPEERQILNKLVKNKKLNLTNSQKKQIFAVFWGKKAIDYYNYANKRKFWLAVFMSIIHSPKLKGGASARILKKTPFFVLLRRLRNRALIIIKTIFHKNDL